MRQGVKRKKRGSFQRRDRRGPSTEETGESGETLAGRQAGRAVSSFLLRRVCTGAGASRQAGTAATGWVGLPAPCSLDRGARKRRWQRERYPRRRTLPRHTGRGQSAAQGWQFAQLLQVCSRGSIEWEANDGRPNREMTEIGATRAEESNSKRGRECEPASAAVRVSRAY